MRLLETPATARRRRVLRDEYRMIPPRRLTSIVARLRRRETLRNKIRRLLHDMPDSPSVEVREVFALQVKLAAKCGLGEAFERSVDVDWHLRDAFDSLSL
jgi:hypothetical protein